MRFGSLIVTALIVGALVSVMGAGSRGFHFLPVFILVSGLVLGVGLLVSRGLESVRAWFNGRKNDVRHTGATSVLPPDGPRV